MVAGAETTIRHGGRCLAYSDVRRIETTITGGREQTVCIDLEQTEEATTAALARLVVVRRDLLKSGRDLRILGLHGHAMNLYQINRMGSLLPCG